MIRPIKPEEKIVKSKIQSIAFMSSRDFSQTEIDSAESIKDYETTRAAFDENGKMCSCLELIPYTIQYEGKSVPMGGIGGVASLPEERGKNYMRHLFEYVLDEMYEKGVVFSYLYPFSHAFYRKLGYTLNMRLRSYSIPITALRGFEQKGTLTLLTKDMDKEPVISIYDQYIQPLNLAVHRTEKLWERFFEKDPYKDNVYLYLWSDSQGEPRGYIKFQTEKRPGENHILRVNELVWLDNTALSGILSFMSGLSAQAERMLWNAPDFVDLLPLLNEPYEIKQEIDTMGMNRVVNVAKALEGIHTPADKGEVTLEVKDEFFGRNSGSYTLAWENGHKEVRRVHKAPDITCDVQALSQLITGFATADALRGFGRLEVHGHEESIKKLFVPKKLYINDFF